MLIKRSSEPPHPEARWPALRIQRKRRLGFANGWALVVGFVFRNPTSNGLWIQSILRATARPRSIRSLIRQPQW